MTGEARSCARRCLAATVSGVLLPGERLLVQAQMQVLVMLPPQVLLRCYSVKVLWQQGTLMKRSCIFLWIMYSCTVRGSEIPGGYNPSLFSL